MYPLNSTRKRKMSTANAKSPAIGIDLGTTFCCVSYMNPKNKEIKILKNKNGNRLTPSYIQFTETEEIIGDSAKDKAARDWRNVIYDSKRLIGQNYDNKHVQRDIKHNWKFDVIRGENNTPLIKIPCNNKTFKPQEVSAKLINYMKNIAEDTLGMTVKNAVITVPAYFNYHQRTATAEAGKIAGLNVLSIMNEPTAAILAYIHNTKINKMQNVLVFDLGGGTLDVSIASVKGNTITVKATSGHTYLGGRDFDNNLAKFIREKINLAKYRINKNTKELALRRIDAQSEAVKKKLTDQMEAQFELLYFNAGKDIDITITRDDFERVNEDLFQTCIDITKNCLRDANLSADSVDKIILVGGSTRIPKVQEMLVQFFGRKALTKHIDQDEAVAYGAAIHATQYKKSDTQTLTYKFTDVTPLTLGIDNSNGTMSIIIPRNSPIPISRTKERVTVVDKQESMAFYIYEGERSLVKHNNKIGKSSIDFAAKPLGFPIELTFHVNDNGILTLETKTEEGNHTSLVIEYKIRDMQTVTEILEDAKLNKGNDTKVSTVAEVWCELEEYCEKMKAVCTYNKININYEEKTAIENICTDLLSWLYNNEVETGSQDEKNAILEKLKEAKRICEPIAEQYGFKEVGSMSVGSFYNYITK